MTSPDAATTKPTKPNKPFKFGPYDKPAFIAHKHGEVACSLLVGSTDKIDKVNLCGYVVFTLPMSAVCIVRHHRQGTKKCKFTIDNESTTADYEAAAKTAQAALQVNTDPDPEPEPYPLPEEPEQTCLCPDGEFKCQPHDIPDCGGPAGVCLPSNVVKPPPQPR